MKTSEALKNFRFERGEHTVILRPTQYEDCTNQELWQLSWQIVGELAWFNPGRVLHLSAMVDVEGEKGLLIRAVASALGLSNSDYGMDAAMKRATIAHHLNNKITRVIYDGAKEEVRGGLEANLERIISLAGDISAIVVSHVDLIAKSCGKVEKISTAGVRAGEEIVTTRVHANSRWTHRYAEIISYLGKVAKEKNICVVSCATPMLKVEAFNRVTSLGLRGVWHWNDGPSQAVDQLYGIQYVTLPLSYHLDVNLWQKLVSYNVATKEVTKTDIFDYTSRGVGFVCHERQKVLDNLMAD